MRPAEDLLHVLARDHRRLDDRARSLLADPERRTERAIAGFATDVLAHEASEQLLLHPLVTERIPGGALLARRRTEEEGALERLLRLALEGDPGSRTFSARLQAFHRAFVEHTDREELEVFPALRHVVTRSELRHLGRAYATLAARLPTRWRSVVVHAGSAEHGVRGCRLAEVREVAVDILRELAATTTVISLPDVAAPATRGAAVGTPGLAGRI